MCFVKSIFYIYSYFVQLQALVSWTLVLLIYSLFFPDIVSLLQPSGKTSSSVNVHNLCDEIDINQRPYLYF